MAEHVWPAIQDPQAQARQMTHIHPALIICSTVILCFALFCGYTITFNLYTPSITIEQNDGTLTLLKELRELLDEKAREIKALKSGYSSLQIDVTQQKTSIDKQQVEIQQHAGDLMQLKKDSAEMHIRLDMNESEQAKRVNQHWCTWLVQELGKRKTLERTCRGSVWHCANHAELMGQIEQFTNTYTLECV